MAAVKKNAPAKKPATPAKPAAPAKKVASKAPEKPAAKAKVAPKAAPKAAAKPAPKAAPAKKAVPAKAVKPAKAAPAPPAKAVKGKAAPAKASKAAPVQPAKAAKAAPVKEQKAAPAPEPKAKAKAAAPAPAEKPAKAAKPGRKPAVPVKKVIREADFKKAKLAAKQVTSSAPVIIESIADSNKPKKIPGVANLASKKEEIVVSKPAGKAIKIPKLTTTSSQAYEPDFTHSVLDGSKQAAISSTPSLRYSDSDLAEFRELIIRKLESAKKELHYLQGLIARRDDQGGNDDDGRYMTMEDGSISMEREQLGQMAGRQIQFIDHLEKAMIRIENKTYGICRVTGKLIDKARLRAVPHATLSMEAKLGKVR